MIESHATNSKPSTTTNSKPRDAASLIVISADNRVLMGRRPGTARFMPGVYVFPGGAVIGEDKRVQAATPLSRDIAAMAVAGSYPRATAIANACIRETYEETGWMLASSGDVGEVEDPSWREFKQQQRAPNLQSLRYIGRAITPRNLPIRFHARFFMLKTTEMKHEFNGDGELEDIGWINITEALTLSLADVTEFMLIHTTRLLQGEAVVGYPFFTYRNGGAFIRYAS